MNGHELTSNARDKVNVHYNALVLKRVVSSVQVAFYDARFSVGCTLLSAHITVIRLVTNLIGNTVLVHVATRCCDGVTWICRRQRVSRPSLGVAALHCALTSQHPPLSFSLRSLQ